MNFINFNEQLPPPNTDVIVVYRFGTGEQQYTAAASGRFYDGIFRFNDYALSYREEGAVSLIRWSLFPDEMELGAE